MKKQILFCLAFFNAVLYLGFTAGSSAPSQASLLAAAFSENSGTSAPLRQSSLGKVEISFPFVRQSGIASNQFAVWIEDTEGNFVKTLYVTNFTVRRGYQTRKEALRIWVKKSKRAAASKDKVDAVSGATPRTGNLRYTWNCDDQHGKSVSEGNYRFFVEGTLFWESSVIYSGTIAVGGPKESNTPVKAEYSSPDPKNRNMIGAVTAVYIR